MADQSIPLFPLNTVLFPGGLLPLQIFEVRYLDMVNKCIANGTLFGVVLLTHGHEVRRPDVEENIAPVGTLASITEWHAPQTGLLQIRCTGTTRFRIDASERLKHGLWVASVTLLDNDRVVAVPEELKNTATALDNLLTSLRNEGVPADEMPVVPPYRLDECGWVANRWCELLPIPAPQKQRLLSLDNPVLRLELVQDILGEQGLLT
ncbi:MAG TPA: LON peptidase substrate-binding domain-containing protein [Noviherbaspirillum sp.]|jgi:hypothetical protein|uniref:LON peptidase substrate-binding domain-containing protein n=1 Tax=Noviherbaspirillum sp. TaxID=1926288 RepID=UPI002DDCF9AE|nr:LON peptidase substrate-binding domain-containing protein [Noviherbaspirillum sp.]HEV2610981.1 LON peptidase substrate-binding domain-containing protein [Noviherbaspirillum sp.]